MHSNRRRTFISAIVTAALLPACSTGPFKPLEFKDVVLQDPLPGQALVYFIRAPSDFATLELATASRRLVVLPPETHTAVLFEPGDHTVSTAFVTRRQGVMAAPPLILKLKPDQRTFMVVAGAQDTRTTLGGFVPGPYPMPIFERTTSTTSRSWKEYNELDAKGLISISNVVLPEK